MNFDSQRVFEINRAPLHLFSMSDMLKSINGGMLRKSTPILPAYP